MNAGLNVGKHECDQLRYWKETRRRDRATATTPLVAAQLAHELHQRAHGSSRWPFGDPRLAVFNPGHSGDVEMDPRSVADEFLEEHRGGDGAAPAAATVDDVGDVGLDHLAIFLVDGQPPHLFA